MDFLGLDALIRLHLDLYYLSLLLSLLPRAGDGVQEGAEADAAGRCGGRGHSVGPVPAD